MLFDTPENSALSGNRTPVSRVAGENSTTEPTMRGNLGFSARLVWRSCCHGANLESPDFCDVTKGEMSTLSIKMKAFSLVSRPVSSVG